MVEIILQFVVKYAYSRHFCNMYLNLHTHHPTLSPGVIEVESVYFGQQKLPSAALRSVGLHPWYLDGVDFQQAAQWLVEEAEKPETLAIGEAGLDKACGTPWEVQVDAFRQCVALSEKVQKPLILHCVRAYAETLAFRKAWNARLPWIYHGFNKNMPTALMLLRAGCYLSFGKDLLNANNHAAECLSGAPEGRFFLETDDAELSIAQVYARAAEIRGLAPTVLADHLTGVARSLFRFPN